MTNILAGFFGLAPSSPEGQRGVGASPTEGGLSGVLANAHSDESNGKGFEEMLEGNTFVALPKKTNPIKGEESASESTSGKESAYDNVPSRVFASGLRVVQPPSPELEAFYEGPTQTSDETTVQDSASPIVRQENIENTGEGDARISLEIQEAEGWVEGGAVKESGVSKSTSLYEALSGKLVSSTGEAKKAILASMRPVPLARQEETEREDTHVSLESLEAEGYLEGGVIKEFGAAESRSSSEALTAKATFFPAEEIKKTLVAPLKPASALEICNEAPAPKGRLLEFVRDVLGNEEPSELQVESSVIDRKPDPSVASDPAYELGVLEELGPEGLMREAFYQPKLTSAFDQRPVFEENVDSSAELRQAVVQEGFLLKESPTKGYSKNGFLAKNSNPKETVEAFNGSFSVSGDQNLGFSDPDFKSELRQSAEAYTSSTGFQESVPSMNEGGRVCRWIESSLSLGLYEDTETALKTEGFNPLIMRTVASVPSEENVAQLRISDVLEVLTPYMRTVFDENHSDELSEDADQVLLADPVLGNYLQSNDNSPLVTDRLSSNVVLPETFYSDSESSAKLASIENNYESRFHEDKATDGVLAPLFKALESRSMDYGNTLLFEGDYANLNVSRLEHLGSEQKSSIEEREWLHTKNLFSRPVQTLSSNAYGPYAEEEVHTFYEGQPLSNRLVSEAQGLPLVYQTRMEDTALNNTLEVPETEPLRVEAKDLSLGSVNRPIIATEEIGNLGKEVGSIVSVSSTDGENEGRPSTLNTFSRGHELLVKGSNDSLAVPYSALHSPVAETAAISVPAPKVIDTNNTDYSDRNISLYKSDAISKKTDSEVIVSRQIEEPNLTDLRENEMGDMDDPLTVFPESSNEAITSEMPISHREKQYLDASASANPREISAQRYEPSAFKHSEKVLVSQDEVEDHAHVKSDDLPKSSMKDESMAVHDTPPEERVIVAVAGKEGVKDSAKLPFERMPILGKTPQPDIEEPFPPESVEGEQDVTLMSKIGMPIAEQSPRMYSRQQRALGRVEAPSSSYSSQTPTASVSGYVQKEINTAPFSQAPSEDVSHFEEEANNASSQNKDLIPTPGRFQQGPISQPIESFSSKMRLEPLPSIPDLNPKLLRQLEQFQRSQRPWAKISLPMDGGEDLMLRMKVSSGHVQIRFGTQSASLREGLERGWSELVTQAASRGIQLDAPEFEARLKTRASGVEGVLFAESSDAGEKPLKRKTLTARPSIDSDEPLTDYPGVLKWA